MMARRWRRRLQERSVSNQDIKTFITVGKEIPVSGFLAKSMSRASLAFISAIAAGGISKLWIFQITMVFNSAVIVILRILPSQMGSCDTVASFPSRFLLMNVKTPPVACEGPCEKPARKGAAI